MLDDMTEVEALLYMEKRFGCLSRTVHINGVIKIEAVESSLKDILYKYKNTLNLTSPIPRIRSWAVEGKVNFLFFDKISGARILLGEWLSGKKGKYDN